MNSPSPTLATDPIAYPFAAVAGQGAAKHALLLLAIEPELRGALIASEGGAGKSTLARAFAPLLPQTAPLSERLSVAAPTGYAECVELPLGITEDRLLGGFDLEATLTAGQATFSRGLLSQADGRVVYVDDINLLDTNIVIHIAHAMDLKQVLVEREGFSAIHSADFILVGTFNATEGQPFSMLRDRAGLIVDPRAECSTEEVAEIIERSFRFDRDPFSFADEFALETAEIRSLVEDARGRLPRVRISRDLVRQIAVTAISLGVEGNRADIFALKAARANAALAGRESINDDDVVAAIQLVLVPRATTLPREHSGAQSREPALEPDESQRVDDRQDFAAGPIEDTMIRATDARVPDDVLSTLQPSSRASKAGKRFKATRSNRGRYVRSSIHRSHDARVAIDATLRAAAPFQPSRRMQGRKKASGKQQRKLAGCYNSVKILPRDLRFKEFKHRSGILFIFAVDASGSMAWNRMAQAKGALWRLLAEAYLHRDKVALISFRGEGSEVLLAPTRSVELAKRLVDTLPAGGGTPISAAVIKAIELARLARLQGISRSMLVLFTDGRANVTLREDGTIEAELRQLEELLRSERIASVVVDTRSKFVSAGDASRLAQTLGSRYVYLPRSDAPTLIKAIESTVGRHRSNH
ncbi:MAG TPA: magnesium chelatase ATPase subunit D [Blastocatellia bacterium]